MDHGAERFSMSTALTDAEILKEKVLALSSAILAKHPTMPTLLREIHTTILKYPEQVTLLNESDIGIIVSGLQLQTGTTLAASVSKPAAAKSVAAKIKQLGADAF
jgi:hypothetical protein